MSDNEFHNLERRDQDFLRLLAAKCHIGVDTVSDDMKPQVQGKNSKGINIINIYKTWFKLNLVARIVAGIENQKDVLVVSQRPQGQRAVLKFCKQTKTSSQAGNWMPGTLTNQRVKNFQEPRLVIVTDPRTDRQAIMECAKANCPVVAFCDTDASLEQVDIAIPCNNKGRQSIAMLQWFLAREINQLKGASKRGQDWSVPVDLFLWKNPDSVMQLKDKEKEKEQIDELEEDFEAGGTYINPNMNMNVDF